MIIPTLSLKKIVRTSLLCVALILLATTVKTFSQDINIRANITDSKNSPVPYAHVYVSDSVSKIYFGTVSDFEGSFHIQIPKEYSNLNLSISCVGYELLSIPITFRHAEFYA